MARNTVGHRLVAASAAVSTLLFLAVLLVTAAPRGDLRPPAAVLTAGSGFGLSGSVLNLAPGVPASLLLTAANPYSSPITVTQVTVIAPTVPPGCPLAHFTIAGQSFAGSPPALTVAGLSQVIPASGSAGFSLNVLVDRSAPNACQSVTLPFTYGGIATGTTTTPSPSPTQLPPGGSPADGVVTVVSTNSDPSLFGQRVTFRAAVAAPGSQGDGWRSPAPSGLVTFYLCISPASLPPGSAAGRCDQAVALGWPRPVDGSGRVGLHVASLPAGHDVIFAVFRPADGVGGPSYTGTMTQVIRYSQACLTGVSGHYRVRPGTSVCVSGRLTGSVVVEPGGALAVTDATISGSITARQAAAIRICGSTIGGQLTIVRSTGYVVVGGNGPLPCAPNTLHSGLSLRANQASFEVTGNWIGADVSLLFNTGTGPLWRRATAHLTGNVIHGSLACYGNDPAPGGGQDRAVTGQRGGQCARTGAS